MADDAGVQLLRAGHISQAALDRARQLRRGHGGTVPERLVEIGAIDDETLTRFLTAQFRVPRVEAHVLSGLSPTILAVLPADLAVELRAIPIAVDREGNLTCALSDPSDEHIVDQVRFFTSRHILRATCTQLQLAWALAHFYGHLTDLGRALSGATPALDSGPTAETGPTADGREPAEAPPTARSGEIEARPAVATTPVRLPAVVVADLEDLDIEPPDLDERASFAAGLRDGVPTAVEDEVVLLHTVKRGRSRQPTSPGVAPVTSNAPRRPGRDTDVDAMKKSAAKKGKSGASRAQSDQAKSTASEGPAAPATTTPAPSAAAETRRPNRVTPVDDGWDMDGWGPPGQTLPPAVATAAPEADTARVAPPAAPVPASAPVAAPPADIDPALVDASAARLLVALRALDVAESRDAVVDATLTFVAGVTTRAGFAALKNGRLSGYRGPGGLARGGDLDLESGDLGRAMARSSLFRGAVAGPEATFAANLAGSRVAEVVAAPVIVRSRLVGIFLADFSEALIEEHLAVAARATGLALERVLKATKK